VESRWQVVKQGQWTHRSSANCMVEEVSSGPYADAVYSALSHGCDDSERRAELALGGSRVPVALGCALLGRAGWALADVRASLTEEEEVEG
jgi:hypothetical protein